MNYIFNPNEFNIEEELKKSLKQLTDEGKVCPTCLDRYTNHRYYGDDTTRKTFSDEDIECMFINEQRARGHMIINTQQHYKDLLEVPPELNAKIMAFAQEYAKILKKVFECESVYLCTMCDGPINHYHVQLIPRYAHEKRGSKNFVKDRSEYVFEPDKFEQVCKMIQKFAESQNLEQQSGPQM